MKDIKKSWNWADEDGNNFTGQFVGDTFTVDFEIESLIAPPPLPSNIHLNLPSQAMRDRHLNAGTLGTHLS